MKNKFTLIAMGIFLSIFLGCHYKKTGNHNFYNYSKDGDLDRIPLIQPYELISADKGNLWILRNKDLDSNIEKYYDAGVEEVGLYLNYIILYTSNTYFDYTMTELWVLINANSGSINFYTKENEYISGLRNREISIPLKLYKTSEVFNQFKDSFILPEEWNTRSRKSSALDL